MAAELHPKPPSPEFITVLTWALNNLWAAVSFLMILLGRIVFGNIKDYIKEIAEQNGQQSRKLDSVAETVNQLAREVSEIKGELKASGKSHGA